MQRKSARDDGAAAVEFALIMPVLFGLVFAIIQFGWLFQSWTAMEGGARAGARYMAVHNDVAGAKQAALADMPSLGLTASAVTITPSACSPGQTVTVSITYTSIMPNLIPGVPSTLTRTGKMQCGG